LPPDLNSRGYQHWFEAFKPEVDSVLTSAPATEKEERIS
jgi:hypothetical protein